MSRVEILVRAGRSAVAKFHELRLKYWNPDIDVVCCFEGGDDQEFFLPHVRRELGLHAGRIGVVRCAGKSSVLAMLDWSVQGGWNLARLGFFIDRDFDDYLGNHHQDAQLYTTDYYSIESHAGDEDYFDNIWQDIFRLTSADARYRHWKDAYYTGLREFAHALRPLAQVALAVKLAGGSVDFDRVKPDELVTVTADGHVARKPRHLSFSYGDVFFGQPLSMEQLRIARSEILRSDYRNWLRGKFLLWFSVVFFARMKAVLGARSQPDRAVVRFHFNADTATSCLCSRATPRTSLIDFLQAWARRIVDEGIVPVGAGAGAGAGA